MLQIAAGKNMDLEKCLDASINNAANCPKEV